MEKIESNNAESYKKDAFDIAQRVSRRWGELSKKMKADPSIGVLSPEIAEIEDQTQPPVTGIQRYFESQLAQVEQYTDESAKSRMMYRLLENMQHIEKTVNEILNNQENTTKKSETGAEGFRRESMEIAQRLSRRWGEMRQKLKTNPDLLATANILSTMDQFTEPPLAGVQRWYEGELKSIENRKGDEAQQMHDLAGLKEKLELAELEMDSVLK